MIFETFTVNLLSSFVMNFYFSPQEDNSPFLDWERDIEDYSSSSLVRPELVIELRKLVVAREFPESLKDGLFRLSIFCENLMHFWLPWLLRVDTLGVYIIFWLLVSNRLAVVKFLNNPFACIFSFLSCWLIGRICSKFCFCECWEFLHAVFVLLWYVLMPAF